MRFNDTKKWMRSCVLLMKKVKKERHQNSFVNIKKYGTRDVMVLPVSEHLYVDPQKTQMYAFNKV